MLLRHYSSTEILQPQTWEISPATLLFGRNLNDHLTSPTRFRKQWIDLADMRENNFIKRYQQSCETKPQKQLSILDVGDVVSIQDQTGNNPLCWEKTKIIAESLPHRQYRVVVDGSRRTTLRNRQFLRPIQPQTRNTVVDIETPTLRQTEELPSTQSHESTITPEELPTTNNTENIVADPQQN